MPTAPAIELELLPITGVPSKAIEAFQPSAIDKAKQERDRLLTKSKASITQVTTAEEASFAGKGLKAIKTFTREIEETRKEVKAPVVDLGKRIDAVADTLTAALEEEAQRLSKLIGNFQAEQNRIAEIARKEAWDKEQALRREAEEKERLAQLAAQAEEDKLQKALEEVKTKKQKEAAETALQTAQAEHAQQEMQRQTETVEKVVEIRQEAVSIPEARKPAGISTRMEMMFKVEDAAALYKAHPMLVKLVPQDALIKAALKTLSPGHSLPGVKHWQEAKAIVR